MTEKTIVAPLIDWQLLRQKVADWWNKKPPCDESSSRQRYKCQQCQPVNGEYPCAECGKQGGEK